MDSRPPPPPPILAKPSTDAHTLKCPHTHTQHTQVAIGFSENGKIVIFQKWDAYTHRSLLAFPKLDLKTHHTYTHTHPPTHTHTHTHHTHTVIVCLLSAVVVSGLVHRVSATTWYVLDKCDSIQLSLVMLTVYTNLYLGKEVFPLMEDNHYCIIVLMNTAF